MKNNLLSSNIQEKTLIQEKFLIKKFWITLNLF
jgi:hypothetical protein